MSSKIALHVHRRYGGDNLDAILAGAPWGAVKGLNDTSICTSGHANNVPIRIYRKYGTDSLDPGDAVNSLASENLSAVTHLQIDCESDKGYDLNWQQEVIAGLRARGYHGNFLIGAFPVGNPAQYDTTTHADGSPHFPALLPLLPLFDDPQVGLADDAYAGVSPDDPRWNQGDADWTVFRYKLLCHCCAQHGHPVHFVVITETGRDQAPPDSTTQGGYAKVGWTDQQYLDLVRVMDQSDQADPLVLARCHFTLYGTQDWINAGFELDNGIVNGMMSQVRAAPQGGPPVPTPPVTMKPNVLDISDYQGKTGLPTSTFAALAQQGYLMIATKATQGTTFTAQSFAVNWPDIKAAGLLRTAYHYFDPKVDPIAQAHYFAQTVGQLGTWDNYALDIELDDAALQAKVGAFLQTANGLLHVTSPYLYMNWDFATRYDWTGFEDYNLWLADYQGTEPAPPKPWGAITIWQMSSSANVPGIAGTVDVDYTPRDRGGLLALGVPAPQPAPPSGSDAEVLAYYEQRGFTVDTSHAIWTNCLLPIYREWEAMVAGSSPLADVYHPGPLVSGEIGATWGNGQPAGIVRLTNDVVGVYLGTDGVWHAYKVELF